MNILFLFLRHSENPQDSTLTKDISDEFSKNGHKVFVATLLERKEKRDTQLKIENGYKVLRVKTGNYFDSPGKLEKGITAMTMPILLKNSILKYFGAEEIDMIFTHTPFISNAYLVKSLKDHYRCKSMLHLWDIFPQNAKDIGLLNNKTLLNYFEKKEKSMYEAFDYIGCMSEGNKRYMIEEKSYVNSNKTFVLKNWDRTKESKILKTNDIREKYNLDTKDFIAVFGGNMGKPQKLENILTLAETLKEKEDIKFLFVGKGTEKDYLKQITREKSLNNVIFIDYVPRDDYEQLLSECDLGIVSLDERFTVPNFPSKTTDYFKLSLPVLASIDNAAFKDYGKVLEEEINGGRSVIAGKTNELKKQLIELYNNKSLRDELSRNGRKYYEDHLGVDKAYKTIMEKIGENNNV